MNGTITKAERRFRLYKAVKYQVENFFNDHGYTVPDMWAIVTNKVGDPDKSAFWRNECIEDYIRR